MSDSAYKLSEKYYDLDNKREINKRVNKIVDQITALEEEQYDQGNYDYDFLKDKKYMSLHKQLDALNPQLIKENKQIANEFNKKVIDEIIADCNLRDDQIEAGRELVRNELEKSIFPLLITNVYDAYVHLP